MDPGSITLIVVLLIVLVLINAFFSASEIAVVSMNDAKLKYLADEGDPRAITLSRLVDKPSRFFAAIQVGVTLSGLLASAVASESFADVLAGALSWTGLPQSVNKALAVTLITVLLSYFSLVLGELVPKRLAIQNAEKIALRVAGVLSGFSKAFRPFVSFLAFSTNLFVKPFGLPAESGDKKVTEEEIRMMVDVGEETGNIEESEKEMINNVFEFSDLIAGDIMTHRTDVTAVGPDCTLAEIRNIAISEGFSRIPVYGDDIDDIIGVVYVKDLLGYTGESSEKNFNVRDIMHQPLFVPETKKCRDLFIVLKTRKQHFAVVVDEYGGTAGIVTMEDLLESIVGDIQDEYDHEEDEFAKIDESTFTIEGTTPLEDASELLGTELPAGEYDTLGGLIIDRLGRIPREDEHPSVEIGDIIFTVEKVEDRRIDRIHAVKKPPQPKTGETGEDSDEKSGEKPQ
jgi:putative hemolysin